MLNYIHARLRERSTWGDIILGFTGAAVLPWPWSAMVAAFSIIKALVPDGPVRGDIE